MIIEVFRWYPRIEKSAISILLISKLLFYFFIFMISWYFEWQGGMRELFLCSFNFHQVSTSLFSFSFFLHDWFSCMNDIHTKVSDQFEHTNCLYITPLYMFFSHKLCISTSEWHFRSISCTKISFRNHFSIHLFLVKVDSVKNIFHISLNFNRVPVKTS